MKVNVLFVSSGNIRGIVPFIKSQGDSINDDRFQVFYFTVMQNGILGYLKNISKIRKKVKDLNIDIIHAHYSFCGWLSVLSLVKKPIVISFMGSDIYGKVDKNGKRDFKSYINTFISIFLQPFVDRIIVKSYKLNKFVFLKEKMFIIPNGVNFNKFRPLNRIEACKKLELNSNKKNILFLGNRLSHNKNFELLKKSLKYLSEKDYNLIDFEYPINKDLIPIYMNASNVLVLCSYFEGSPNIIKEAMACNVPIVSVNVGDVSDVIKNTKGCYLVEYNEKEMAEAIKKSTNFKRTNGRDNIGHLEISKVALKIKAIYNNLISL